MIRKILIIDDDEDDRELLRIAVESVSEGTECVDAIDGEKGFIYLTNCDHLPDYIFLDLNMPRISGLQTLELIKNYPAIKDIPVVIYTTSKSKMDQQKSKELGAIYFITKPEKLCDLEAALRFVFERKWESVVKVDLR